MKIKKLSKAVTTISLLGASAWLASCGGGGSNSETNTDTAGGSTSTVTSGRITGFGSVIVNGVHFDTDAANITHDGEPINESDLKVGMIIRLSGEVDADGENGTATEIEFDEELKGPISSIDMETGTFVVLGQSITVDSDTVFDDTTFDTLEVGNVVEVSGYFDANGGLQATLVELYSIELADGEELEIKGVISALDTANLSFTINGQMVDYSAAELEDIPDGTLADGMFVEVEGSSVDSDGILLADKVESEEADDREEEREEGRKTELEGLITALVSDTEFEVNGQRVLLDAETEFTGGTAADLSLNNKIRVEGEYNSAGVLVAEEVKLRRHAKLSLEATVDSVDLQANTLTMLDITVLTTLDTVWEDDSEAEERYFNLELVNGGDFLEVRGHQNSDGTWVASKIERQDRDEDEAYELKGPVESITANGFTVMGISVSFTETTEFEDELDAATFLSALTEGSFVEVEGTLVGSTEIAALEVELEEDDRNEFGGERDSDEDDEAEGSEEEMNDEESEGTTGETEADITE